MFLLLFSPQKNTIITTCSISLNSKRLCTFPTETNLVFVWHSECFKQRLVSYNWQRLSWLGHVERMEEDRMPKKIFTQELEGTRRRGRPRERW